MWWLLGAMALMGVALAGVGLRTLPGSPLAAEAASRWESATPPAPSASGSGPASAEPTPSLSASPTPSPTLKPLAVHAGKVTIKASGWWSWAMIDRRTGKIYGSSNMSETNTTASLIKSWIGADYLRRAAESGQTPSAARMQQLTIMIRDSDNEAAQSLWEAVGGSASIGRLIKTCKLTDSSGYKNMWSNTRLSPATPPGWASASRTAAPPVRSGRSGCSARCARCAGSVTSGSGRRSRRAPRRASRSRTAG
ncbi:hypothetical protein Pflav_074460 [Phytohabitans flavus]|uniref:Uncharacterized protein n=1 Tax=Phytohabitans flavus TaxID=1076124 RepID=A0A6F8Y4J4_9ACTN|nr:hypothetical protein Pflav_074460 [Phytohabitans flavus]